MRLPGSAETLEARRRHALALLDEGRSLNEVGRLLGCSPSSVQRWRDARERDGDAGLKVKKATGRPSWLSDSQKRRLVKHLLRGPLANGYSTDLWTTRRVAEVIRSKFGVQYTAGHVGRLLGRLGWSR